MKKHIEKLHHLATQNQRNIIGLMSGTSLDGLDVAFCEVSGNGINTKLILKHFATIDYSESLKGHIRKIFAKREIDFQDLCLLNPYIGNIHGEMVLKCLKSWNRSPEEVDLIASHGQTVFHAPEKQHRVPGFPNATLQIGDGDHIAVKTGIITMSDFRQKHIAAGGEGAPLAVYGDYFLFSKKGENRILLNMGGIANFTMLPANMDPNQIFTTDTGPGNTLIDTYMRHYFRKPFDKNGDVAAKGTANELVLAQLQENPFFSQSFPKTTGPEVFSFEYVEKAIQKVRLRSLSRNDVIATLTRLSADSIAASIRNVTQPGQEYKIFASGGGAHNRVLIESIQSQLPDLPVYNLDQLGVSGDAKEAVLFAVLANEAVAGTELHFGVKDRVPNITMGKISLPQ